MKQTDFDFIKDKFDNSGVNAPEALSEETVISALPEQSVRELPPKKSKKKLAIGVSAAAAVAVVTAAAVAVTGILNSPKPVEPVLFRESAGLRSFSSREEVKSALSSIIKLNEKSGNIYYNDLNVPESGDDGALTGSAVNGGTGASGNSSDAAPVIPVTGSASESYHNSTYIQSVGVDEADTVKTNGGYIFYLHRSYPCSDIEVFSAEGKDSKLVAKISEAKGGAENDFVDFYTLGEKLVTLSTVYSYGGYDGEDDAVITSTYAPGGSTTVMCVYDVSDINNITLTDSFSQSGSYVSSRMIGDTVYIISNQYAYSEDSVPCVKQGADQEKATPDEVSVDNIYSVATPDTNNFLVVSSVDTAKGSKSSLTKAIIGTGSIVYCNKENLYITARQYSPAYYRNMLNNIVYDDFAGIEAVGAEQVETQIVKINLSDKLEAVASGSVEGSVNNQYALDEYQGMLRVATTSMDESNANVNNLFVLDGELKKVGEVSGFAKNETIQAVRYIDETAYVITYEQTDPLFVIDVSDPTKPKITGEVEISGFSTLLVPIDGNTLLGIGYHTENEPPNDPNLDNALKIVTFDVSDRNHPKVLDTKLFEKYSSQVQYNPKALLVNFERGDFTIPMEYWNWVDWEDGVPTYHEPPIMKSGALNFRVDNGKINVIDNYTSEVFKGDAYGSGGVERCVYVDDTIYMLGTSERSATGETYTGIDSVKYK